jgi:hypothetical protein
MNDDMVEQLINDQAGLFRPGWIATASVYGVGERTARGRGWKLMIFRARATRGRGLLSLDARSGRLISPHPCRYDKRAWMDIYIVRRAHLRIDQATLKWK